jgi:hypothetical protein
LFYFASLLLLVFSQDVLATDLNKSGYVKSYINAQQGTPLLNTETLYQSQNSARLMLDVFTKNKVWQIHYEGGLDLQSSRLFEQGTNSSFNPNSYRFKDLQARSGDSKSKNSFFQNLDRFNVQLQLQSGDLTIGRQAITLGSARIINPTDVFLPFNVRTRNTEYRTGIDAIRFQKPLGELSELDLGIIVGENAKPENSAFFIQYLNHFSEIPGKLINMPKKKKTIKAK